jgi:hypothetical protein
MTHRFGWLMAVACLASFGVGCADDRRTSTPAGVMTPDAGDAAASDAARDVSGAGSCTDGVKDGAETDVDCGGGGCARCGLGARCKAAADCQTGACNASGICVECILPTICPGVDTDCSLRTCVGGACGIGFVAAQTLAATQIPGDCKVRRCDGLGNAVDSTDDNDLPDDSNPCTQDRCSSGVPSHTPVSSSAACGTALFCDGQGHCVGCLTAPNCPGTDNDCRTRTCVSNVCGFDYKGAGTATTAQVAGDCKVNECDGAGNIRVAPLATDVPDDGNPCTLDQCASGTPSHAPAAAGLACGTGGLCDGAGHCVSCLTGSDCPAPADACQTRTCSAQGVCGLANVAAATAVAAQTAGDCQVSQCDGNGHTVVVPDNTDLPVDGNLCTGDVCTAGVPSNPALAAGTACGGLNKCDGAGHCVQCVTAADCPGQDTACETRTCSATGVCGLDRLQSGTPIAAQIAGDCAIIECDANGAETTVVDDADLPVDGNACTADVCTGGVPSNPPLAANTACGTHATCDGAGSCVGCMVAGDCPGTDTACQMRTCSASFVCGLVNVADGTQIDAQTPGDCKVSQCDGRGNIKVVLDASDVPVDGNACTQDVCGAGVPSNPPVVAGAACGSAGGVCDGHGACVTCLVAGDCGADTACATHACAADHTCATTLVAAGTRLATQVAGDCQAITCDGHGATQVVPDDTDLPNDGNPCTDDQCADGIPSHPPSGAGTSCGGTSLCDGNGNCVQCTVAADCGIDTACQTHACGADHTCSTTNVQAGTALPDPVAGDCQGVQCDGQGSAVAVANNADVLDDGNPCTADVCTASGPAHPPKSAGTVCGAGQVCDGAGACVSPAPGCSPPYVFCDNFEDGNATGWSAFEQTAATPGVWSVVAGDSDRTGAPTSDYQQTGTATTYHYQYASVTPGGQPLGDQTVSVWLKPTMNLLGGDANKIGICARLTSDGTNANTSGYCLFIRADGATVNGVTGGRLQVSKKAPGGGIATLGSATFTANVPAFALNVWHNITLQVSGASPVTLTCFVDGVQRCQLQDTTAPLLTTGGPGLIARAAQGAFDDVAVSSP